MSQSYVFTQNKVLCLNFIMRGHKTKCFCLKFIMCGHKTKCFCLNITCVDTKRVFVSILLWVDTKQSAFVSILLCEDTKQGVFVSNLLCVYIKQCFCLNMWTQKCFFKFIINYFGSTLYVHFLCPQLIIDPKYEQLNKIIWKF